jgi:lipopolysaccharide transport system ATP-binding protein
VEPAIVVRSVGKRFPHYDRRRPATLHAALVGGLRWLRAAEYYWALREVSLTVAPGQMVGVVGANGAGKSTLLNLIGDIVRPDEGLVTTRGRINALFDLTAGFHPDLTGLENVHVGGVIAGLTRTEVASRLDSIVAFAELEPFIHSPLRTYSSGMRMRLAFAVAAHTDPDVLLVDEVLAVGDRAFQEKCLERIARFKLNGCAVVFVSHDLHMIPQICDEAIWLRAGRLMAHGSPDIVIRQYQSDIATETRRRTPVGHPPARLGNGSGLRVNENRFGSLELEIVDVRLVDSTGLPVSEVGSGEPLRIELDYTCRDEIESAVFGVTILREDNLICYETSTIEMGLGASARPRCGRIALELQALDLNSGHYFIDVGAYRADWAYAYDYHWRVYPLTVHCSDSIRGVVRLRHRWFADRAPL